jgi:hypothetical protein
MMRIAKDGRSFREAHAMFAFVCCRFVRVPLELQIHVANLHDFHEKTRPNAPTQQVH